LAGLFASSKQILGHARFDSARKRRVLLMAAAARRLPVVQVDSGVEASFSEVLAKHGLGKVVRGRVRTLQVNMGKLCNMACLHCHVEAGPKRTEIMPREVADRIVDIVAANPGVEVVDITGGAPELNPSFPWLVTEARRLGREVIDRCNLTVLFEPGLEGMASFLAAHEVHVVASLPCYQAENVEKQRGQGAFGKSIEALKRLNTLGYGRSGTKLKLDLVYNPSGAYLPPAQGKLEAQYKDELGRLFGVEFNQLLTITNMPIKRFAHFLERTGRSAAYTSLIVNHFNPQTVPVLMCRSLLSVSWDGRLYDCDFNQMLDMELESANVTPARSVWNITSLGGLEGCQVATAGHCFGCAAGNGSSCTGALR
jgi:radical SAM/Cys-rich protein